MVDEYKEKKEIFGHYRGFSGNLYWIKAIKREDGRYDVYTRQYSPALQCGWSYWDTMEIDEVKQLIE